jgi:hypothetical protein
MKEEDSKFVLNVTEKEKSAATKYVPEFNCSSPEELADISSRHSTNQTTTKRVSDIKEDIKNARDDNLKLKSELDKPFSTIDNGKYTVSKSTIDDGIYVSSKSINADRCTVQIPVMTFDQDGKNRTILFSSNIEVSDAVINEIDNSEPIRVKCDSADSKPSSKKEKNKKDDGSINLKKEFGFKIKSVYDYCVYMDIIVNKKYRGGFIGDKFVLLDPTLNQFDDEYIISVYNKNGLIASGIDKIDNIILEKIYKANKNKFDRFEYEASFLAPLSCTNVAITMNWNNNSFTLYQLATLSKKKFKILKYVCNDLLNDSVGYN